MAPLCFLSIPKFSISPVCKLTLEIISWDLLGKRICSRWWFHGSSLAMVNLVSYTLRYLGRIH